MLKLLIAALIAQLGSAASETNDIHQAAKEGDVETMTRLLEVHDVDSRKDKTLATPLHYAVSADEMKAVKLLIEKGAGVDKAMKQGITGLHLAAGRGHTELVRLLLEHGASASAQTELGETALDAAAMHNHTEAFGILCEHASAADRTNALFQAVQSDNRGMVDALIQAGVDIAAARGRSGQTVLHEAARFNKAALMRVALEAGVAVDVLDVQRHVTPLHFATAGGAYDAVQLLLDHGANASVVDVDGNTPLHFAMSGGQYTMKVATLLVSTPAVASAMSVKNKKGSTALHLACSIDHHELTQMLVERGAAVHDTDDDGRTTLHAAVMGTSSESGGKTAEYLILQDVEVEAKDNAGKTVIDMLNDAIKNGHEQFTALLNLISLAAWLIRNGLPASEYLPIVRQLGADSVHDLAEMAHATSSDELFEARGLESSATQREMLHSKIQANAEQLAEDKQKADALAAQAAKDKQAAEQQQMMVEHILGRMPEEKRKEMEDSMRGKPSKDEL